MPQNKSFFTKSGRKLNPQAKSLDIQPAASIYMDIATEQINTLWQDQNRKDIKKSFLDFQNLKNKAKEALEKTKNVDIKPMSPKTAGVMGVISALIIGFTFSILSPTKLEPNIDQYAVFSSKPLKMENQHHSVYTRDSRSQRLNEIFKLYNCPLEGLGEMFVNEADKNDIPWWIAPAIAFQESSCGKNTPRVNGQETYNAWGWAVYGENVHTFDNWARGIETVSKYLGKRFYSQGISDTCEIMKTYTPPSNGSWCEGVNHFRDLFVNYKTPDTTNL